MTQRITWLLPEVQWAEAPNGTYKDIGAEIKINSVELVPIEGETRTAQNIKGQNLDMIQFAQNFELNLILIAPTLADMAAILSNATHTDAGEGTPESLAISNTMIKGYKKVKVIPEEVGQIQLEMPYCRVFTGIGYNGADGYYLPIQVIPLVTDEGKIQLSSKE